MQTFLVTVANAMKEGHLGLRGQIMGPDDPEGEGRLSWENDGGAIIYIE